MKDKFYELVKEASTGSVIIDGEPWNIYFDTLIEKNNKNIIDTGYSAPGKLIIRNEDKFFELLEEYLKLEISKKRKTFTFLDNSIEEKEKYFMMNLLINATTEDFLNPENFLRRNIAFQKDKTLNYLNEGVEVSLDESFFNSKLVIRNELTDSRQETPYKIALTLKDENNHEYHLPSIYYGIDHNTCYIYSILNDNSKLNELDINKKYVSKINRLLYKINKDIIDSDEYYDYKNKISSYYPEDNISDITSSFILALNIFITILEHNGVNQIKAVPYLPLRYISREEASNKSTDEKRKKELHERNINIQTNLTNKFIRTFRRLAYQNSQLEILTYPYEIDEYLTMRLLPRTKKLDNILLEETNSKIR